MKIALLSLMMCGISLCALAQDDDPACSEINLEIFSPFDGFYLTDYCKYAEFGSAEFMMDNGVRPIQKEGVYREVWFRKKEDNDRTVSGLQILKNHVNAIVAAGGEVVRESDGSVFRTNYNGKEVWIYVNANTYSIELDNYGIISIEVDIMKQEVTAQDIKGSLATQGKIALYGILFDTGMADIKPESEKALLDLATYLKENPLVNVYITGHTDSVGDDVMNQKLSLNRAESVVNALVARHGIIASRLAARGVGPYCPVASNDAEEGRALNRRVEVVRK